MATKTSKTKTTTPAPLGSLERTIQLVGYDPTKKNTAPTTTAPTTQADTKPDTPKNIYKNVDLPNVSGESDSVLDEGISYSSKNAKTKIDENAIRAQTIASFQGEVDATNAIFADKLMRAKKVGAGRLGEVGAMSARRGLLGSDFGKAQYDQQGNENEGMYNSIEQAKALALYEIADRARKAANDEIDGKKKAKKEGLEAYLAYSDKAAERKSERVKTIAKALLDGGVKISEVDPSYLEKVAASGGMSVGDIVASYNDMEKANRGEELDLQKKQKDLEMIDKNFEENQRQFGLQYALDARKQSLEEYKAQREADATAAPLTAEKGIQQIKMMQNNIQNALNFSRAAGRSGARRTVEGWTVGATDFTNLETQLKSLQTNALTLFTDPNIKKFFGPQMSDADVAQMLAAGTTLNAEKQGPEEIQAELLRISELVNRAALQFGGDVFEPQVPTNERKMINGSYKYADESNLVPAPDGLQIEIVESK